ncbi:MAG: hypothetical protein BWX68_02959 [Verrucomicrobia bacterium ADurb.Bin063]|nr:MAG: hypothetical protein BWX68_02959 [Verrucomicrobia bacterium ADurb.Bin063]
MMLLTTAAPSSDSDTERVVARSSSAKTSSRMNFKSQGRPIFFVQR